ncbi:MAG: hypothetical protein KZQ95_18235 [Candidatus Thiodiazotropha sp. (ex Epidulcina cf. delphinae)]|nr:hypothetical protein [Candidatus Thiodiazotropha sp. (ex Epidulcina cf. delphinae)]
MVSADIETWRHRLYDISWFMRNLNETIARRANAEDGCSGHTADETPPTPKGLLPFIGRERIDKPQGLPFSLTDYLQLTDWTGRAIRDDKSGAIPDHQAPILERLNIDLEPSWIRCVVMADATTGSLAPGKRSGNTSRALGRKWLCVTGASLQLYRYAPC